VHLPAEELGRRAVTMLMHKLEGDSAEGATLLPPTLTVRESSAAPAAAHASSAAAHESPAAAAHESPAAAGDAPAGV
jgi:hypothetical protein